MLNRVFLFLTTLWLLPFIVQADTAAGDIEPVDVEMHLQRVSPHAYFVQGLPGSATENQGFISNAGVVITNEGVVLFDALGSPSLAALLRQHIREITPLPVVKVVVSHYHADHVYGLQVFKAEGAEIIAPRGALNYLASEVAEGRLQERRESLFPWVNDETRLVPPDIIVDHPYRFQLGGLHFEITPLGSTHSDGDQTLRVEEEGVLFSGDLIFEGRIPLVAGSDPQGWLEGLQHLDTHGLEVIVPGHGSASHEPQKAVAFTRDYLRFLHDGMAKAVEEMLPFDEAYAAMDWSRYANMPAAVANRLNAYYVYLGLEAKSMDE